MTDNPQAQPFFSVVIPTYNRANLILKTLDTVFAQKFTDFEVIVVDNHSSDDTEQVLAPLAAQGRIRFIRHDQNYERARGRNTGMQHAQGKYLTFLDSDDYMYPDNLLDAHAFALAHPDFHLFHNLYEMVTPEGKPLYRFPAPNLSNPVRAICKGNFFSCIGTFISREVYTKIRFDEYGPLTSSEDYHFWLQVVGHFQKVGRINKINNGLVQHGGRTVNNIQVDEAYERNRLVYERLRADPELGPVYGPYARLCERSAAQFGAISAFKFNRFGTARRYLLKALVADPSAAVDPAFWRLAVRACLHVKNSVSV